jgi:hypothetical protein
MARGLKNTPASVHQRILNKAREVSRPFNELLQHFAIERFNRTYREEVLSLYLFRDLAEVRETTYWWMIEYNEDRPHDSLGDRTPAEYMQLNAKNSTYELSTK